MNEVFLGNPPDYVKAWLERELRQPFCIEALEDGSITLKKTSSELSISLVCSLDSKTWNSWDYVAGTELKAGQKLWLKAESENAAFAIGYEHFCYFSSTCRFKASGNIMSLLYNDFKSKKELASDFCLMNLFLNSSIADASTLFLPATRLSDSCYNSMFSYCLQLAAAPKLPATELGVDCYRNMFLGSTLIKELHFPASVENNERFTSMYKSPTFGADNATAYFDL